LHYPIDMDMQDRQSTVFKRNRIITVSLVTLCLIFQNLALYGIAIFLPEIRKTFGLSFTEGGAISAASILAYTIMQIPSGYLADRFGYKKIFFTGALTTTVLCLAFGFTSTYWQAVTNQAFSGLFRALLFAPALALVTNWFSSDRRAAAMSLASSGLYLAQVFISGLGPPLAAGSSWHYPFIVFGAAGIVISLGFLWFGKGSPSPTIPQQKVNLLEVFHLFRYKVIWLFGILQYARAAIFQGIAIWLPSLLIEEKGMALQVVGIIIAVRGLLTIPANILGGYISDKTKSPIMVIAISFIILAITTALFVRVDNMVLLVAIIMVNSFFVQFYFGPMFAMPVEILGKRMAGTSMGFGNFFANIGGFTLVYLLGVLKDASGSFESGFYAIAGLGIVGLVFTFILAKIRRSAVLTENIKPS
jgi:sugar phosphate permease